MSEGDRTLGVRASAPATTAARTASTPEQLAWLLAAPCALVLVGAILLLGPPLGRLLLPPADIAFWPTATVTLAIRPEPTEQARFLIALAGPVLLSALVALLWRRPIPLRPATAAALAQASQILLAAFVAAAVLAQHRITYDASYSGSEPFKRVYFTPATLVVAALLTAGGVALLRREALTARIAALTQETRGRRIGALAVALLFVAAWMLTAVNTEATIASSNLGVYGNASYWLGETFALLDGRAPLVDFHAQYSQLWPYLSAGVMAVVGETVGVYVAVMIAGSAVSLLAVYAILRRLVERSWLALALFLPFLATGFFMELGPASDRYGPSNLFSMFPMRYAGAYLLAWLTVRHLAGARPLHRPLLFLAAGLVLVNNVEFGLPAMGATVAAVLWTDSRPLWPRTLRLLRDTALGLLGAAVLVALLTLAVAGSLPDFSMMTTFSRLWGLGGVTMLPMPAFGLHLAIYVTFAAAIVVATVRTVGDAAADRSLTGVLVWAGVFGLGASSYFAGRSHPEVLINLFSAWAFALVLLAIVAVRALLARPGRRPTVAEVAVLAGFAIAVCSLAQTPLPTGQLDRLGERTSEPPFRQGATQAFVAPAVRPGERVVILAPMGHRVADDLGLVNVAPYVSFLSMPAQRQLTETLDALRASGGDKLFVFLGQALPDQQAAIEQAGFRRVRADDEYAEYRDTR